MGLHLNPARCVIALPVSTHAYTGTSGRVTDRRHSLCPCMVTRTQKCVRASHVRCRLRRRASKIHSPPFKMTHGIQN
jgi:hypothetical protein